MREATHGTECKEMGKGSSITMDDSCIDESRQRRLKRMKRVRYFYK